MKHFTTLILFTLFSLSSSELIESNITIESMDYKELVYLPILEIETVDDDDNNSSSQEIKYSNFTTAKEEAIKEDKYILIKVEADDCQPCNRLNALLDSNEKIKKIVKEHIKAVKINSAYDSLPDGLYTMGTPTVFLLNPKDKDRVLMKLVGTEAIESLEESLDYIINDSSSTNLASL